MKKVIMAVGVAQRATRRAHADDIELNIGGTLLKYRDKGVFPQVRQA
jgi:hypothetical protein